MTSSEHDIGYDLDAIQRRIRLVVLLNAAQGAGLSPLPVLHLHTLAYLSNVLAPVWDMPALDGKVLKRRGGPFYPALQRDLDRLVGMGVVAISGLGHEQDEQGRWRLEGSYRLNRQFSDRILHRLADFERERRLSIFVQELAFAFATLSDEAVDRAVMEDATYSDPMVDFGNVVDFAEWQQKNFSANAARYFENFLPDGIRATPGEKLHMYVRHLNARIIGAG